MRAATIATRRLLPSSRPFLHFRPTSAFRSPCFIPHASSSSSVPNASTTSIAPLVYDTSLPEIVDTAEVNWAIKLADELDLASYPRGTPYIVGTIAYRQSYRNCSDSKWAAFREKFDALMMKRWRDSADSGSDPKGIIDKWNVLWVEDEKLEGKSMSELRCIWQVRTRRNVGPSEHFFLMINDEVVDSVLKQSAEGQIPFVYVIDPRNDPLEEEEVYEDDAVYQGYLKIAVEVLPGFWCAAGGDCDIAMEKFGESERIRIDDMYW